MPMATVSFRNRGSREAFQTVALVYELQSYWAGVFIRLAVIGVPPYLAVRKSTSRQFCSCSCFMGAKDDLRQA
jgi:hypothetical protein